MKLLSLFFLLALNCFAVSDRDVIATTLIAEAGGERVSGAMEAVYEVIVTRSQQRGISERAVVLQPKQFSCWNGKTVQEVVNKARRHPRYTEALNIVGTHTTFSMGANHYHADYVNPHWARYMKKTTKIGRHIFYTDR